MSIKRVHILLPGELLREIDALVGPRGRSSFLAEIARNEVRRQKLLRFLENTGTNGPRNMRNNLPSHNPAWKDKDHPELAAGARPWVRELRRKNENRHTIKKRIGS